REAHRVRAPAGRGHVQQALLHADVGHGHAQVAVPVHGVEREIEVRVENEHGAVLGVVRVCNRRDGSGVAARARQCKGREPPYCFARFWAKSQFQSSFSSNAGDQLLCSTPLYSVYLTAPPAALIASTMSREPDTGTVVSLSPWNAQMGTCAIAFTCDGSPE